ncbi:hypothetical protein PV318_00600 [Streptomyces sp. ME02-6991-2B]|nr:hypothetical protein [Streptomyces sp. ME02-6991-2B]
MAFLEDARRVGLLRQVGGVYQFRHAQLQARLAASRRGGAPARRRRRGATRAPWPVRPLPAAGSTPQSARVPGYVGLRRRRGQPALYVAMWTLALLWTGIITYEDGWHDPGAAKTVGFFVALPLVVDLLIPPLTWRRAELRLDEDGIEFAVGKQLFRFEWRDIAEVAARLLEPPIGKNDDGTVMLHLRLTPEATPGPRIRVNNAGWVALWPLEVDVRLGDGAGEQFTEGNGDAVPRFQRGEDRAVSGADGKGTRGQFLAGRPVAGRDGPAGGRRRLACPAAQHLLGARLVPVSGQRQGVSAFGVGVPHRSAASYQHLHDVVGSPVDGPQ